MSPPSLDTLFAPHQKKKPQSAEKETQEVAISVPPSMPPAFPSFSFHHISFFISADSGHSRLVFISRALSKQKKSNLRFISKCHLISIESPPPVGSTVKPKKMCFSPLQIVPTVLIWEQEFNKKNCISLPVLHHAILLNKRGVVCHCILTCIKNTNREPQ